MHPKRPSRRRHRAIGSITGTAGIALLAFVMITTMAPLAGGRPSGTPSAAAPLGRTGAVLTAAPLGRVTGSASVVSTHPIVTSAGDRTTGGYWLVASDGGVFAFGAPFDGSAGALRLVEPIVGMAASSDSGGYWLVASDGGIFAFGTANFRGSMGGQRLNQPIVGMASTADGGGYWLVASDGGIFAFGTAAFLGSTGAITLNSPMVGMQATGSGYRLVAADGGLFSYNTPFAGSAVGVLTGRAVSLDSSGPGYRIVSDDGSVYAYGGASFDGSVQALALAGRVITIDPGHNGGNGSDPGFISTPINGGGFTESCDTAGTATADGYDEHSLNFDVAMRLDALLAAAGATVVLTHTTDTGVGPCVNTRAAIANAARSDAAISIHGDGGPVSGRGFAVDVPVPVVSTISNNTAIVPASGVLGLDIRDHYLADTGEQVSDYSGVNGITPRSDLGGLNLSTVPKVLIECANMQNPADAALVKDPNWRQSAAQGLFDGIASFLTQR